MKAKYNISWFQYQYALPRERLELDVNSQFTSQNMLTFFRVVLFWLYYHSILNSSDVFTHMFRGTRKLTQNDTGIIKSVSSKP